MKRNRSFFFKSIIISLCALICIYCFAPFVFGATYPEITVQYDTVLEGASSVDPTTSYTFLAEYFYITDNNSSTNTVEEPLGYSIESVTSTGSRTVATMTGSMTTSTGTTTNMESRTFYLGSASPNVGDIVYSDSRLSTQSGYVISSASRYVSITIPDTVPTHPGATFTGWSENASGSGTLYNAGDVFKTYKRTSGTITTLYATWEYTNFSINLDTNGGEIVGSEVPAEYTSASDDITIPNPVKFGYEFEGWSDGTDEKEPIFDLTIPSGSYGDVEYSALWEPLTYNITYNLDGGENNPNNPDTYTYSEEELVFINSPSTDGYEFAGWVFYDGEEPYVIEEYVIENGMTGDIELVASWNIINYDIILDLGEGEIKGDPNPETYTVEDDDITITNPVRNGYDFAGWTSESGEMEPVLTLVIPSGSTGTQEFYATWTSAQYKITYILNGGENNPNNLEEYTFSVERGVSIANPTRTGYEFKGWLVDEETEAVLDFEIEPGFYGDITLEATWETIVYEIEYNLDGGSLGKANPSTYTVEDEIVFNNPTKYSHEFTGWSNGGTIAKGSTGNVSVKANWNCLHFDTEIRGYKSVTTEADGYTGDTYCLVCGNKIAVGEVKPMIVVENIDIENIDELFDENIEISPEQKEALTQLAEKDIVAVMEIVGAVNKAANGIKESYLNGDITKEEYEEAIEKIQAITDSAIELCSNKEAGVEKGNSLNNVIPKESGIDIANIFGLFYQRQIDILLGKAVVTPVPVVQLAFGGVNTTKEEIDLSYPLETYQNVQNFVDDSLDKMTDAVLMLRSCSGGSVISEVKYTINILAAKTFRDFDKEKADNEFVENAYNAILATVQERVLAALDETYAQQVKSGNFTGTASDDLKKEYQEQYDACSDIEQFELMVIEVMRLKYSSVFEGRLSKGLIARDEYNQAMTKSTSLEVFEPVYKEIFRAWALNEESEYGITLSELSDATIETTTKKVGVEKPVLTKLTSKEITFFASFGAAFAALALCLALAKRKEDSYGG